MQSRCVMKDNIKIFGYSKDNRTYYKLKFDQIEETDVNSVSGKAVFDTCRIWRHTVSGSLCSHTRRKLLRWLSCQSMLCRYGILSLFMCLAFDL